MTEEQEAKEYLLSLSHEQLITTVDYTELRWECSIQGCDHSTRILCFGIRPLFRWRKKWIDLTKFVFWCGKHNKIRRLYPDKKFVFKEGPGIFQIRDKK